MKIANFLTSTLAGALLCGCCAAAEGGLSGPVAAVIYDGANRSINPVPGIPGAAYVGAALADGIDAGAFAPDGKAGLYVKDGGLYLARWTAAGTWSAGRVSDAASPALIVWSADSHSAAVIGGGSATVWKADGTRAAQIDGIPGQVASAALDENRLIAAVVGDAGSGIYLFESGAEAKRLASADRPVSVAVAGSDVFFADRARNEVWMLRDYRSGGDPVLIANVTEPVGVATAGDSVIFASAADRKAWGRKIASAEPLFELSLDFAPSGVQRFGNTGWLLNAGGPGPMQVLVTGPEAAVYFIPRGQERSDSAQ